MRWQQTKQHHIGFWVVRQRRRHIEEAKTGTESNAIAAR